MRTVDTGRMWGVVYSHCSPIESRSLFKCPGKVSKKPCFLLSLTFFSDSPFCLLAHFHIHPAFVEPLRSRSRGAPLLLDDPFRPDDDVPEALGMSWQFYLVFALEARSFQMLLGRAIRLFYAFQKILHLRPFCLKI